VTDHPQGGGAAGFFTTTDKESKMGGTFYINIAVEVIKDWIEMVI
jgi:hypothetical protein